MSAARKAALAALAIGLAAALAAGFYTDRRYRSMALDEAFTRLSLFHELREATLEDYLRSKASDVRAMSQNRKVVEAFVQLNEGWSEFGSEPAKALRRLYIDDNPYGPGERSLLRSASDDSRYSRIHAEFHDWARRFLTHFGYKDMFLIGKNGDILYSVEKNDDFATNLEDGAYANGALGYVFHQAMRQGLDRVTLSDFEQHGPDAEAPSVFAGSAIPSRSGEALGVFAVRFTGEPLDEILRYAAGMGETGQTYIVGNDFLMRSQSRFDAARTSLAREVDTAPARAALNGFSGSLIAQDYRGARVLSVYAPLDFGGAPWVLLAEMEQAEVLDRVPPWPALLAALIAGALAAAAAYAGIRQFWRS